MKRFLVVLLAVPAFLLLLLMFGISFLVLSLAPPVVTWVAVAVLVVVVLWFVLGRRGSAGVLSESALMGRQSAKDGLL